LLRRPTAIKPMLSGRNIYPRLIYMREKSRRLIWQPFTGDRMPEYNGPAPGQDLAKNHKSGQRLKGKKCSVH
jgi:hypothetical protein